MTKRRAVAELIFAAVLWGFGFVATIWALTEYTSAELLFLRFTYAFTAGILVYFMFKRQWLWQELKLEFRLSFIPGILLGLFMMLQTVGMETTTATKSGFITAIYVMFVPIINHILFRYKTIWQNYVLALFALFGTYLLMGGKLTQIVRGDYLTLVGALVAAFHIIIVGVQTKKSKNSFLMNCAQSFWAIFIFLPFMFSQKTIQLSWDFHHSFYGVMFLALGSSLLAFTIQIRAQKVLSDELASQLFLLEAPVGFFFGYMILGEGLEKIQLFGAALIIATSSLSIRLLSNQRERSMRSPLR